jgi:hypothetical protein
MAVHTIYQYAILVVNMDMPSKMPDRKVILAYLLLFLRESLDIQQVEAKNNFIIRRIKKLIFVQSFIVKHHQGLI